LLGAARGIREIRFIRPLPGIATATEDLKVASRKRQVRILASGLDVINGKVQLVGDLTLAVRAYSAMLLNYLCTQVSPFCARVEEHAFTHRLLTTLRQEQYASRDEIAVLVSGGTPPPLQKAPSEPSAEEGQKECTRNDRSRRVFTGTTSITTSYRENRRCDDKKHTQRNAESG
jgi:hypothetical protein